MVNIYKYKAVSKYSLHKHVIKLKSINIKGIKSVGIYLQSQFSHAQK